MRSTGNGAYKQEAAPRPSPGGRGAESRAERAAGQEQGNADSPLLAGSLPVARRGLIRLRDEGLKMRFQNCVGSFMFCGGGKGESNLVPPSHHIKTMKKRDFLIVWVGLI